MLVSDHKLYVLLILVAVVSISSGANLRHVGTQNIEEDEETDEVNREESDIDENVHNNADINEHSDDEHDENDVAVAAQEVVDGDDEEIENGADDTTAAGDGGDADGRQSDHTTLIKDIKEVKIVNDKLQQQMDTLNSELDKVLKSDDSKKGDEHVIAENKDQSEQDVPNKEDPNMDDPNKEDPNKEDPNKEDREHANFQDKSEDAKSSDKDVEGKSGGSDQRKPLDAPRVDTRIANYVQNNDIGEDRNLEADPDY